MNIFEFAKEKEKLAEEFYRDRAAKSPNKGLANVFTLMADQEELHFEMIENMQNNASSELAETNVLSDAVAIFEKIKDGEYKFNFEKSELELYKEAREVENQARKFYIEKAGESESDTDKDIFLFLADEEKKHYMLLDNIIDFVSQPEQWLEDAEFYHLQDY